VIDEMGTSSCAIERTEQPAILDMAGLFEPGSLAFREVADALVDPCQRLGVFHVVGHGIPTAALDAFRDAARALFALPEGAKQSIRRSRGNARGYYDRELTKNRLDAKEVFDYGASRSPDERDAGHSDGRNQWPEEAPELRPILLEHHAQCVRVARALLHGLCASLGAAPNALDTAFERDTSFVRLNRYLARPDAVPADAPLFPETGALGVHHHSDAGAFTLLVQDEVAGLQVLAPEGAIMVAPVPSALSVNLGDMLQVCSNDRYRSPLHRVIVDPERTRYSAPFFFNPSYTCTYAPLEAMCALGEPARYRPISWAHFRDQRSAGDFADYGSEIQIADYRIPED